MKRPREADPVPALFLLLAIAGCIAAVFLRPEWKERIGGNIGVAALFVALGVAVVAQPGVQDFLNQRERERRSRLERERLHKVDEDRNRRVEEQKRRDAERRSRRSAMAAPPVKEPTQTAGQDPPSAGSGD